MKRDERRAHGVHYTTEPHILRVLRPLLFDDLDASLKAAHSADALRAFLGRLVSFTFLDPACGTGNFLVVAYQQLRRLQTRALRQLAEAEGAVLPAPRVSLSQFHGIEIDPASAASAAEALRHAAAQEDERAFDIPSQTHTTDKPHLVVANALRIDWNDVLPAARASFVFGNPPFVGTAWMTREQQEDRRLAFSFTDTHRLRIGRLDYATSWIAKSIAYGQGKSIRFAFVVTNSMTQGEHPRTLGPIFQRHGYHIDFAYRTFPWRSNDPQKASVHVVILGFSQDPSRPKRLFDVEEKSAKNINMYLIDGPDVFPAKRASPLRPEYPIAMKGNQPTDGGHLLIRPEHLAGVLSDPIAKQYVRRYMQTTEFLWNQARYCLWLVDATPDEIEASPILRERTRAVHKVRANSRTPRVRELANRPALFTQIRQPSARYLALPEVSSAKRKWIPAAFLEPDIIAGNKLILFPNADTWLFGLLQSSMFFAWVRALAGRMKSDISISPDLVYSTFPFPEANAREREGVVLAAERVLQVRKIFCEKSLGELYDPRRMPDELEAAHVALDQEVDALFAKGRTFAGDDDRLEVLLARYLLEVSSSTSSSSPRKTQ